MKSALFSEGSAPLFRLIFFSLLSVALIFLDQRSHALDGARELLGNLSYPLLRVADAPSSLTRNLREFWQSHEQLSQDNRRLRDENHVLHAQLLQLRSLRAENQKLRELLKSSQRIANRFIASRLLAVTMTPGLHRIIIDKGAHDGVEPDMPILDDHGVMGHISRVYAYHAEAILISDANHAIPVSVQRSGIRSIAAGLGRTDQLKLLYLPVNADIRVGDEVVTSGLGGKFPPDYPVGVIREIARSPDSPFADIRVEPYARLDTSKEILIVTADLEAHTTESGPDQ